MGALEIILGIAIIVLAAFLVTFVLLQSGKEKNLSGAIAGGADTYFGKTKSKARDKWLSRLTTVLAIVFAILAVIAFLYVSSIYHSH